MDYSSFEQERRFRQAWSAVDIVRPVHFSLFTFGETVLPYILVCGEEGESRGQVSITRGEVRVKRPLIITRQNARPEFRNFFQQTDEEGFAEFLLARTASFSNLHFNNQSLNKRFVQEGMEAVVAKLSRKLDDEQEDRVAILTAPPGYGGMAVLRYAAERVWQSAPDNIQELRERGFLS